MIEFDIKKPEEGIKHQIRDKIDNLNKPKGSLGRLENIALQICLIQQTLSPTLHHPCHLLLGGDHGIEHENVSVSPRDVTWQQMINFTHGGGGINMFCRQHNFDLRIVDMGVDHDLTGLSKIRNCKIAYGTNDFLNEPAMTEQQFDQAIATGAMLADECIADGCNVISIGEMGIANTSPSSIWMSIFGNIPLEECIGVGAGLNDNGLKHKKEILMEALKRFYNKYGTYDNEVITPQNQKYIKTTIQYFGGFEMVGAIGAMLRAAEKKVIILVDGFIMSACMLAASRLYPEILPYAIFGHRGDENGHQRMLKIMNAKPILNLGMRLGEGTGAVCAYPIIDSAVRMVNEMNNFENAKIDKYF